ncbi:MAG: hypothetical protein E6H91_11435 [Chloroflexi bacterium]|nr:MAG: hypothetical protein E6H91_11435 [Chloroflexota bacterium]
MYRRELKKMFDLRAICATCGHTYERHDRDAMRSRQRDDPGIERPCYREVGGAACRCGGFRGWGELAMPASGDRQMRPAANRLVTNAVLTLLLVVLGLALLYAYRSQTPTVPQVSLTQAIQDVQAGKIRSVTVVGNKATLEFRNGTQREQTTLPEQDQLFAKAIVDYNAAHPDSAVDLVYQSAENSFSIIGSIVLSMLPCCSSGASSTT